MQQEQYIEDINYLLGLNNYISNCIQKINNIKKRYNINFDYGLLSYYEQLQEFFVVDEIPRAIGLFTKEIEKIKMIPQDMNEHCNKILETIQLSHAYKNELCINDPHAELPKVVANHFDLLDKLLESYLNKTNTKNFNKDHYDKIVNNLQSLVKNIKTLNFGARKSYTILYNLSNKLQSFKYNIKRFTKIKNYNIDSVNQKYNYGRMNNKQRRTILPKIKNKTNIRKNNNATVKNLNTDRREQVKI